MVTSYLRYVIDPFELEEFEHYARLWIHYLCAFRVLCAFMMRYRSMGPADYWSQFFGVTLEQLDAPGLKVVTHSKLADHNGALIFTMGMSEIISVPARMRNMIEDRAKSGVLSQKRLSKSYARHLFDDLDRVTGPCYQGYYPKKSCELHKNSDGTVRKLSEADDPLLDALKRLVDPEAWEHSVIAPGKVSFGCFQSGQLIAAACLDMWSKNVANIGLITAPSHRGMGYAKQLCAFATAFGLKKNYLMVYQTTLANSPAVAIAKSIGYTQYASLLAVRFRTT